MSEHKVCPHCHKEQRWAFRTKKGVLQITIGLGAALLGIVFFLIFFFSDTFGMEKTASILVPGGIFLGGGGLTATAGIIELRHAKSVRGQKLQRPTINFP